VPLTGLQAVAHPYGHRIDLSWVDDADPVPGSGVRVVRREGTFPTGPDDGTLVADVVSASSCTDDGLPGETVFYYSLFAFAGNPPVFSPDPAMISAMTTARYDFGGRMYDLLPRIYQRFDTVLPAPDAPGLSDEDRTRGELRRFLDLPGSQLDQLYSLTRAALSLHDVSRTDGQLLPLLAGWIGWQTDRTLPLAMQRNEIRFAPELYRTIGSAPVTRATVGRITGWPSRAKEYVHNVARTNQPERLNLWTVERDAAGSWGVPGLLSLNHAFEGRPVHLPDTDGSDRLVYQTARGQGWEIWTKQRLLGVWQPSEPVVGGPLLARHPAAALQGTRLWVFWESLDLARPAADRRWQLMARTRTGTVWSDPIPIGDPATEQRGPAAAVDRDGGLWLFWRERTAAGWSVRYNRHDGTNWQLADPATLPDDAGTPVPVDDDLTLAFPAGQPTRPLWLFWAARRPGGPVGQTRWSVSWRVKAGLDPTLATDWSAVTAMPKASPSDHDREPAALPTPSGNLELFWSSTRGGGWSVVRSELDLTAMTWGAAQRVGTGPGTDRGPCVAATTGSGVLLVYLSNTSLPNAGASPPGSAVQTLDTRYAGTTTVRVADSAKLALAAAFEDFQTYTYQSGHQGVRTPRDRIARDTVGLFVDPPVTVTAPQLRAALTRLAGVLPEFMPMTSRFVLVTP
jgi:phage tail-like protein